jgi:hypothetical protein
MLSGKRKFREVEVMIPPRKRMREVTAVMDVPWASIVRLLEASEARAAESSGAAAMREEGLQVVLGMVSTGIK